MSLKNIMRDLKEMKDGIGNISKGGGESSKVWLSRTRSNVAPNRALPMESEFIEQSCWTDLPPELLLDIIERVEQSETTGPARAIVVFCAAVCRSWRDITYKGDCEDSIAMWKAHVSHLIEAGCTF